MLTNRLKHKKAQALRNSNRWLPRKGAKAWRKFNKWHTIYNEIAKAEHKRDIDFFCSQAMGAMARVRPMGGLFDQFRAEPSAVFPTPHLKVGVVGHDSGMRLSTMLAINAAIQRPFIFVEETDPALIDPEVMERLSRGMGARVIETMGSNILDIILGKTFIPVVVPECPVRITPRNWWEAGIQKNSENIVCIPFVP